MSAAPPTTATLLRFIDLEISTVEISPIERLDRNICGSRILHLDKPEPARSAGFTLRDQIDSHDRSVPTKKRPEFLFRYGEGKVSDVQTFSQFRTLVPTTNPPQSKPEIRLETSPRGDRSQLVAFRI